MTIRTLAVGNGVTNQVDHRSLVTALTATSGGVDHLPGLFPASEVAELVNVSAMVVGVGPFKAILPNQYGAGQYLVQSDSEVQLTFDPGEAGVTRTDRIIVRVYNNPQDGSGLEEPAVEYLKGQSSGSATALPDGALLIWEIPVPAGASAGTGGINFTTLAVDKRSYTTAAGGVIPVETSADLSSIAEPYEGLTTYVKSLDVLYVHDGTTWRPRGVASVASSGSLTSITNPYDGMVAVTRDTDLIYVYNGSSWIRHGENETGIHGLIATGSVNSTSYANLPATSSFSFTKLRAGTRLRVDVALPCFSDAANTGVQLGVTINGTDYDITRGYFTSANIYQTISGFNFIAGIPAGTYTIQGRWKRTAGSGVLNTFNTISDLSLAVKEIV